MATCLDVITLALKLSRTIAPGETPDANESADGLTALQSLYDQWRTGGMFGQLEDTYPTGSDVAEEGRRYYTPSGVTISDPTSEYVDGLGETRQPRDLALYEVLTSTGTHTAKLYDRTGWVSLLGLTLTDAAPLSSRNLAGLAACLATYGGFAAMFGDTATLNPDVRKMTTDFLRSLSSKAGSTQDASGAEYF